MSSAPARKYETGQLSVWDYIAPAPNSELRAKLVALAVEMLRTAGDVGVIIGEVVLVAEAPPHRLKVGGEKMENKIREQRQTSWLAHVMPEAGGVPTGDTRPSPVPRHHHKPQRVYVARKVER